MKFTICARLEKAIVDGTACIRMVWETEAPDLYSVLMKARSYISTAELEEKAECVYLTVEAEDA